MTRYFIRLQRLHSIWQKSIRTGTAAIVMSAAASFCSAQPTSAPIGNAALQYGQASNWYESLDPMQVDNNGEVAIVSNLTYTKDAARITFKDGMLLLQRPILGRPTKASFVGHGEIEIRVPAGAERNLLKLMTTDTIVRQSFELMQIFFADEFDIQMRASAQFSTGAMPLPDFRRIRDFAGQGYFSPQIINPLENQLSLLVSALERKSDGFFWCSFNRWFYSFDPYQPEAVRLSYNPEPTYDADMRGPVFPANCGDTLSLADLTRIAPLFHITRQRAFLHMGGMDGWAIDSSTLELELEVLTDSLRFPIISFDSKSKIDSVCVSGTRVEFVRRDEQSKLAVVLPAYVTRGSHIPLAIYTTKLGRDYASYWASSVEYGLSSYELTLCYPKGYNYRAAGLGAEEIHGSRACRTAGIGVPSIPLLFGVYATGIDTFPSVVESGIRLHFLADPYDSKRDMKRLIEITKTSVRVFARRFAPDDRLLELTLTPTNWFASSVPGLVSFPSYGGIDEYGGMLAASGGALAYQWFGTRFQAAGSREAWMPEFLSQYAGLQLIAAEVGLPEFYENLKYSKNMLLLGKERGIQLPLAIGSRASRTDVLHFYRGTWLLHMLRMLMIDLQTGSDDVYEQFVNDVRIESQKMPFSWYRFCQLAEKHFGGELGWFFQPWLLDAGVPEFSGTYEFESRSDGHWVVMDAKINWHDSSAVFAPIIRVNFAGQSAMIRKAFTPTISVYEIGPFPSAPESIRFNDLYSILCKEEFKRVTAAKKKP